MHEQSRTDRDQYVTINWENIDPKYHSEFEICWGCDNQDTPYDYESVMHYGPTAFALNYSINTIDTHNGEHIGQRNGFSDLDIIGLNKLYPCGKTVILQKLISNVITTISDWHLA